MSSLLGLPSRLSPNGCREQENCAAVVNSTPQALAKTLERKNAVLAVRKSKAQGCAVVYVGDQHLVDLCHRQSVAIIDGCCVELKRHSKPSYVDGEERLGIFVAWGRRVDRKVSVSEDSLREYFNALAEADMEETPGLTPQAPFKEGALSFTLISKGSVLPILNFDPRVQTADSVSLTEAGFCPQELVEKAWDAKARLDAIWKLPPPPLARSLLTRVARAQLFPHSGEGGKEHENRAGTKLEELAGMVGLLHDVPKGSGFLDLCGGPGAWSQFLLAREDLELQGFGFTLRTGTGEEDDWKADDKDQWYPDLLTHHAWTPLWGADGSGDLLKPGNIEHAAGVLADKRVFLCVADGGFSDAAIPPGQLELYFYRLFLGELLMAASCLENGGRFVCKLYSTFSTATASLLYLATRMFDNVAIVKPCSSRVTGPERYLSCAGFRWDSQETVNIRAALSFSHEFGAGRSPLTTPLLTPIVGLDALRADEAFVGSISAMATRMCERQALALGAVVDRSTFLEEMAKGVCEALGISLIRSQRPACEEEIEATPTPARAAASSSKWTRSSVRQRRQVRSPRQAGSPRRESPRRERREANSPVTETPPWRSATTSKKAPRSAAQESPDWRSARGKTAAPATESPKWRSATTSKRVQHSAVQESPEWRSAHSKTAAPATESPEWRSVRSSARGLARSAHMEQPRVEHGDPVRKALTFDDAAKAKAPRRRGNKLGSAASGRHRQS